MFNFGFSLSKNLIDWWLQTKKSTDCPRKFYWDMESEKSWIFFLLWLVMRFLSLLTLYEMFEAFVLFIRRWEMAFSWVNTEANNILRRTCWLNWADWGWGVACVRYIVLMWVEYGYNLGGLSKSCSSGYTMLFVRKLRQIVLCAWHNYKMFTSVDDVGVVFWNYRWLETIYGIHKRLQHLFKCKWNVFINYIVQCGAACTMGNTGTIDRFVWNGVAVRLILVLCMSTVPTLADAKIGKRFEKNTLKYHIHILDI